MEEKTKTTEEDLVLLRLNNPIYLRNYSTRYIDSKRRTIGEADPFEYFDAKKFARPARRYKH